MDLIFRLSLAEGFAKLSLMEKESHRTLCVCVLILRYLMAMQNYRRLVQMDVVLSLNIGLQIVEFKRKSTAKMDCISLMNKP